MTGQEMIEACHGASARSGWWADLKTGADLRRTFNVAEKLCLIHSELSEGWDGYVTGAADDKLPQYPMLAVELADAAIRAFDLLGAVGAQFNFDVEDGLTPAHLKPGPGFVVAVELCKIHKEISDAMEGARKKKQREDGIPLLNVHLVYAVFRCFALARALGYGDLEDIMVAKLAYNAQRADHKPENRKAEGGKAY